jgi:hypothetical protein
MRCLLVLVLALVTVSCGDDVLRPTYVPQAIYPYPPNDGLCVVPTIRPGWYELKSCP